MHEQTNGQQLGIWIDHRKTVFVAIKEGQVTFTTFDSSVPPHGRYAHATAYATPNGTQSGGGEKKYEERNRHELERYYDEVIKRTGMPEAIYIFGPGEAKTELKSRMKLTHGLAEKIVAVEAADEATDPQIVAKVKAHFGVAR